MRHTHWGRLGDQGNSRYATSLACLLESACSDECQARLGIRLICIYFDLLLRADVTAIAVAGYYFPGYCDRTSRYCDPALFGM